MTKPAIAFSAALASGMLLIGLLGAQPPEPQSICFCSEKEPVCSAGKAECECSPGDGLNCGVCRWKCP